MIEHKQSPKKLLSLSHDEAQAFFLKHESYFNADLPPYFQFENILQAVKNELGDKNLNDLFSETKPRDCEGVNHLIIANKDGKLSWRPFQLIHPVLYVNLVREITKEDNWNTLKDRFDVLHANKSIKCLSMPLMAVEDVKDRSEQVSQWWQQVELQSVELALDYELVYETDITDCYGAFYTHSIAWAVETKDDAKQNRDGKNLGNFIDQAIQAMQHGQTNGIPQGSVLMDFVAEIILGYVDVELTNKLKQLDIATYQILRYRDDYRVFVNNSETGERILKVLSEVLADLGLRLNSNKTSFSSDIVGASIKKDKKAWIESQTYKKNLFKHAMLIKQHADRFPNSGSLSTALSKFYERVLKLTELDISSQAVISCIVDIAYKNPRTYPVCFAILSKFISLLNEQNQKDLIKKIQTKFTKLSNVGYMEVWFQRAIKKHLNEFALNEPLCKLVKGVNVDVWNSEWIGSTKLKRALDASMVVNLETLSEAEPIIDSLEFNLFPQGSG